jgi:hypothetical protein
MAAGMAAGWPCRDEGSATAVAGGGRAGAERRCSDAAKGARRPGALKRDGGCGEAGESVFHSAKFAMRRAGQRRGGRGEAEAGTERRRHLREEYKESRERREGHQDKTRQARRATGARALHAHLHACPLAGLPLRLALALGHWRRGHWRRRHGQPPRRADQPPTSIHPPPTHHPSRRRGGVTWRRYAASLFGCPARFSLLLAGTRWPRG